MAQIYDPSYYDDPILGPNEGNFVPPPDETDPAEETDPVDEQVAKARLLKMWEDAGHDPNKFYRAFIAANNLTANQSDPANLQKIVDALNTVSPGIAAMDQMDSNGHLGGIILNGQKVQAIDGNNNWTDFGPWKTEEPTTTATSPALTESQLAAQEALVTYPDFAPPEFNAPEFNAPGQFAYPDYASPTPEEAAAEPGYEFGRKEGLRAMTNASSAQGLLRTGGTLKDMMAYGQGLAGQQYRDVDTRKRTTWEGNRFNQADIYDRDYRNAITENMLGYNREADIYNRALSTYGTNLGTAGSRAGISSDMQDRRWGQLLSLYNIATRNLPSYTPTASSISPTGFTG